ncbi:MAG: MotA/TolQ/ExbB proton channel family protein [Candidatus Methylophosphatis roskildensis]
MNESLGFAHFLAHTDVVARVLLVILCAASIGTWFFIVVKGVSNWRQSRNGNRFLDRFWSAASLGEIANQMSTHGVTDHYSHLVHHGFSAVDALRGDRPASARGLIASGSPDDFLTRSLKRGIDQTRARLEYGQTFLASVASSAPFVGLFGTVWGIYHALIAIGISGQGTLDKVAGPVGEALIMTGIGLAVAIPAALAYNFFARATRNTLAELGSFAHDVFALLSTGVKTDALLADPKTTGERVYSMFHNGRTPTAAR